MSTWGGDREKETAEGGAGPLGSSVGEAMKGENDGSCGEGSREVPEGGRVSRKQGRQPGGREILRRLDGCLV